LKEEDNLRAKANQYRDPSNRRDESQRDRGYEIGEDDSPVVVGEA